MCRRPLFIILACALIAMIGIVMIVLSQTFVNMMSGLNKFTPFIAASRDYREPLIVNHALSQYNTDNWNIPSTPCCFDIKASYIATVLWLGLGVFSQCNNQCSTRQTQGECINPLLPSYYIGYTPAVDSVLALSTPLNMCEGKMRSVITGRPDFLNPIGIPIFTTTPAWTSNNSLPCCNTYTGEFIISSIQRGIMGFCNTDCQTFPVCLNNMLNVNQLPSLPSSFLFLPEMQACDQILFGIQ